ncbi:hypothetical protein CCP3SC15_2010002 [Gammaproteobacteria bacterium]
MSVETAQFVISNLAKNYGKNFPKAGIEKIWPDLVKEPAKAMESAFDFLVMNKAYLPTPQELLQRVQHEAKEIRKEEARIREAEWTATKEEGSNLFDAARDEHAKAALMCLTAMQSNKSPEEKLKFFRMMEDRYPGRGWGLAGISQQKWYGHQATREHWNPNWRPQQ